MEHQIHDGDFINIRGNRHNPGHPIQVALNYGDHPFIFAHATCICSNTKRNFGKWSVSEIDVNYGDIFCTEKGQYRLDRAPLSDGVLTKMNDIQPETNAKFPAASVPDTKIEG